MSTIKSKYMNIRAFYKGFGSAASIAPRQVRVHVIHGDVAQRAASDVAAAWSDVGTILRDSMNEFQSRREPPRKAK